MDKIGTERIKQPLKEKIAQYDPRKDFFLSHIETEYLIELIGKDQEKRTDFPLVFMKDWIKENARKIIATPGLQPTEEDYMKWIYKQIGVEND